MQLTERTYASNLIAFLVTINLYILWSLKYLPFWDAPPHIFRIFLYFNLDNPLYDYSRLYKVNYLVPYLWADLIKILFCKLGFGLYTAQKLFYSVYIVSLPVSLWYLLRRLSPGNEIYSLVGVLITFNRSVATGTEAFMIGMPVFLFAFTYWVIHLNDERPHVYLIKALFTAATYFSHAYCFGLFLIAIGLLLLLSKVSWKNRILSFSPFIALFLHYFLDPDLRKFAMGDSLGYYHPTLIYKIYYALAALVPRAEDRFITDALGWSMLLMYAVLLVKAVRDDKQKIKTPLFVITMAFLLLWLALPHWLLHLIMPDTRAGLIGFLLIPALFTDNRKLKIAFVVLIVPVILTFQYKMKHDFDRGVKTVEYIIEAFDKLPPNRKLLPISLPPLNMTAAVHHCYTYYHLEKGGGSPYFYTQAQDMVTYRDIRLKLQAPPILDKSLSGYTKEILDQYDLVALIGLEETEIFKTFVKHVSRFGFKKVASYKKNVLILQR